MAPLRRISRRPATGSVIALAGYSSCGSVVLRARPKSNLLALSSVVKPVIDVSTIDDEKTISYWLRLQTGDLPIVWAKQRDYNPDFVAVTIQSYRHRYGNAPGDPAYDAIEAALAASPSITVPTIVLHGEEDGVGAPASSIPRDHLFTGGMTRHLIPRAGHFLSRENPEDVVAAVVRLAGPAA